MRNQLTLAGFPATPRQARSSQAQLSGAQRAILARLRESGSIRAVEAGTIVHAYRPGIACEKGGQGAGCCCYASTDGSDALKRLQRRGLVERVERGAWNITEAAEQPADQVVAAMTETALSPRRITTTERHT